MIKTVLVPFPVLVKFVKWTEHAIANSNLADFFFKLQLIFLEANTIKTVKLPFPLLEKNVK